jgi:hypothetical protein
MGGDEGRKQRTGSETIEKRKMKNTQIPNKLAAGPCRQSPESLLRKALCDSIGVDLLQDRSTLSFGTGSRLARPIAFTSQQESSRIAVSCHHSVVSAARVVVGRTGRRTVLGR